MQVGPSHPLGQRGRVIIFRQAENFENNKSCLWCTTVLFQDIFEKLHVQPNARATCFKSRSVYQSGFSRETNQKGDIHTHMCILRDLVQGKGLCDFGDQRVQNLQYRLECWKFSGRSRCCNLETEFFFLRETSCCF